MITVDIMAGVLWLAVTAYALLGGADFGGGFWDLTAGDPDKGAPIRARIEHSIGPVWEANHVWLIFVLVVLWTAFPAGFASVASTFYIPLTFAAFGIILRGSGFAFRKLAGTVSSQRFFGATFALSSILTPFFLGAVAGGIASGRVPVGIERGAIFTSWINPTSILGGILAVATCAWLAATYLTVDSMRSGEQDLAEAFRKRALYSGVFLGVMTILGIGVLDYDAHILFEGLITKALPLVIISILAGLISMALLWKRSYKLARQFGALAIVAIIWGWGVGQFPKILVGGPTLAQVAAPPVVLHAMLWSVVIGGLFLIPSLGYLFFLFNSLSRESKDSNRQSLSH